MRLEDFCQLTHNREFESTSGQAIIDKMFSTYRALQSYQDFGYVVDTEYQGTNDEHSSRSDFSTHFKRGKRHQFRFQWQHPSSDEPSGVWAAGIWSNGKKVYGHYPATGTKREKNIGWAIGSGAGALSDGVANKSLFLLMQETEEDCAHHFPLDGFEWLSKEEEVFGEQCHHLRRAAAHRAHIGTSELWISAERFALLKVRETEIIDHIRSDAWHLGRLGDDPVENERIVEDRREVFKRASERSVNDYIQKHGSIEDWRRRAFELSPYPRPKLTETFYAQVSFNCEIRDENLLFGNTF